nr:hypothetical protein [Tanacetum cinerariifolium]
VAMGVAAMVVVRGVGDVVDVVAGDDVDIGGWWRDGGGSGRLMLRMIDPMDRWWWMAAVAVGPRSPETSRKR